jgi:hypothetical protein
MTGEVSATAIAVAIAVLRAVTAVALFIAFITDIPQGLGLHVSTEQSKECPPTRIFGAIGTGKLNRGSIYVGMYFECKQYLKAVLG